MVAFVIHLSNTLVEMCFSIYPGNDPYEKITKGKIKKEKQKHRKLVTQTISKVTVIQKAYKLVCIFPGGGIPYIREEKEWGC